MPPFFTKKTKKPPPAKKLSKGGFTLPKPKAGKKPAPKSPPPPSAQQSRAPGSEYMAAPAGVMAPMAYTTPPGK